MAEKDEFSWGPYVIKMCSVCLGTGACKPCVDRMCSSSISMECRREGVGGSSCESERQRERARESASEIETEREPRRKREEATCSASIVGLFCLYSRPLLPL
jgi:hypothetical protein